MAPKKSMDRWIQWGVGISLMLIMAGFSFAGGSSDKHMKHDDERFKEVTRKQELSETHLEESIKVLTSDVKKILLLVGGK